MLIMKWITSKVYKPCILFVLAVNKLLFALVSSLFVHSGKRSILNGVCLKMDNMLGGSLSKWKHPPFFKNERDALLRDE